MKPWAVDRHNLTFLGALLVVATLSCTPGGRAGAAREGADDAAGGAPTDGPTGDSAADGAARSETASGAGRDAHDVAHDQDAAVPAECADYCAWARACAVATCDPMEGEDCSEAAFAAQERACRDACAGWRVAGGPPCGVALQTYFGDCLAQDICGANPPLGCLQKMDDFYAACQGAPLSDVCRDFCAVPRSGCYPYTDIGVRSRDGCEAACRDSLAAEPCKAAVYDVVDCVRAESDLTCGITGPPAMPCRATFARAAAACAGFAPSVVVPAEQDLCAPLAEFRCRCGSAFLGYDPAGCVETLTWACLFDIATRPTCPAELAAYLHDCLELADCADYRQHLVCHDDRSAAAWDCF